MERRLKHGLFEQQRRQKLRVEIPTCLHPQRQLTIYTWGMHRRTQCTEATERDYSAESLTASREHRSASPTDVMKHPRFLSLAHAIVEDVEKDNLHTISVYCCKGLHRSVAVAEYLKRLYPQARLCHLE